MAQKPYLICVDDEEHNNQSLLRLFRKEYEVLVTTDVKEALGWIDTHKPPVIISDQRMPDMTGVELFKKSLKTSPRSKRILLTGYTDLESVITAINDGHIFRYLTKPWEPTDLQLTVQQAIEAHKLEETVHRQKDKLQELDQLKTEFMLLVSHELRTPLTSISSFLQLAQEEKLNETLTTCLERISSNTDRMQSLVEDILIMTRLGTKGEKLKPEKIDLSTLIDSLSAQELSDKSMDFQSDKVSLKADKTLLTLAFKKLLSNIREHASSKEAATCSVISNENHIEVTMTNLSEKKLPKDLDSLKVGFSKNEDIMNHSKGAGLGLAVVDKLLQQLGGKLELSSKGAHFTAKATLPLN